MTKDKIIEKYKSCRSSFRIKELLENFQEELLKGSTLKYALKHKNLFKDLIHSQCVSEENLQFVCDKLDEHSLLEVVSKNSFFLQYMLSSSLLSFDQLIQRFKSKSLLHKLLMNQDFFKASLDAHVLTSTDVRQLFDLISTVQEMKKFNENSVLLLYAFENKILDLNKLIEKHTTLSRLTTSTFYKQSIPGLHEPPQCLNEPYLYYLLNKKYFFRYALKHNLFSSSDLRHLFDLIDNRIDLSYFDASPFLVKYLFQNSALTFAEWLDKHFEVHTIEHFKDVSYFYSFLKNSELVSYVLSNNIATDDDLKNLLHFLQHTENNFAIFENAELLSYLFLRNFIDLYEFVEDLKRSQTYFIFLNLESLFELLSQNSYLNIEKLQFIKEHIQTDYEYDALFSNRWLVKMLLENNQLSFADFYEYSKWNKNFLKFLKNHTAFEVFENLNAIDLKCIQKALHRIHNYDELMSFCSNSCLALYALKNFIFDKDVVERFDDIFNNFLGSLNKKAQVFDILPMQFDEKLSNAQELIDQNKKIYMFHDFECSLADKFELHLLFKSRESIRDKLLHIIENHLEDTFENFEDVLKYLKKSEKKHILNI